MSCVTKRRGRYVIDCYDQHGKRYRKTLPLGTNKEQARKELREIETKIEHRTFLHEKKTPLFSEVKAQWLQYKKTRCRETTWEMYAGHCGIEIKEQKTPRRSLKNHFTNFDGKRINRITTATVETFITAKQEENISLGTLRRIMVTLNQIMGYAVRHQLIDYNPVRDAERPKNRGKIKDTQEMKILSPDQIRSLIEAEPLQKYRNLYLTAIMTGARQGELLGLKWSDIDFDKKQINVRRTYNHERWFEPKTKGSIRRIDLAPIVVKVLAEWKLKTGGQNEELVFPSVKGTPIKSYNLVRRHFLPALKAAGLNPIRFHDLRHTYASLLLLQGENIKYVQNQLGHATPMTTLNVYAHLMKTENQEAAIRLENTVFG